MKANIALFSENSFQLLFQAWQNEICTRFDFVPDNRNYWPHISLKQPFFVADVDALTNYFVEFASSLPPMELTLSELNLWAVPGKNNGTGVLFFEVVEQKKLYHLHQRLNADLSARFEKTEAPFDGPQYHPHLTLAVGGASIEDYQCLLELYQKNWVARTVSIKSLSLGCFDEYKPEQGWRMVKEVCLR